MGDILEKSILPWLGKTMKMIDNYVHDKMKISGMDLSKEQWLLLKVLIDEDGRPQNELAFITNRDKGSLARLVNTMEGRNLVARIPSKTDRRINHIYLTKHGRQTFESSKPIFTRMVGEIEKGISKKEREQLILILQKIRENIKTEEVVAVETKINHE